MIALLVVLHLSEPKHYFMRNNVLQKAVTRNYIGERNRFSKNQKGDVLNI